MSKPFTGERRRLYIVWACEVRKYNPQRLKNGSYQRLRQRVASLSDSKVRKYLKAYDDNRVGDKAPVPEYKREKNSSDS